MDRRAHSWDPSPAALARGTFEGCAGAMVRAFELPFAPATGITDLSGSVCQGGVRCPVTDLYVLFASAAIPLRKLDKCLGARWFLS